MNPADLPSPSEFPLRTDLQMRFNDIDILGHLNNTVYFSFYDTGKAYYLEAIEAAQGGEMNWRRVEAGGGPCPVREPGRAQYNPVPDASGQEDRTHQECLPLGDGLHRP